MVMYWETRPPNWLKKALRISILDIQTKSKGFIIKLNIHIFNLKGTKYIVGMRQHDETPISRIWIIVAHDHP